MPPVCASTVERTELMSTCWGTPVTPAAVEVVTMRPPPGAAETMGKEEMGRPPVVIVWRALCKSQRKSHEILYTKSYRRQEEGFSVGVG